MYKSVQYSAVDMKGAFETSSKTDVTAVTWGVFPDREILQVHSVLLIASLPSALLLVFSGARISV